MPMVLEWLNTFRLWMASKIRTKLQSFYQKGMEENFFYSFWRQLGNKVGAQILNAFGIWKVKFVQIWNGAKISNGIQKLSKMATILSKKFGFPMVDAPCTHQNQNIITLGNCRCSIIVYCGDLKSRLVWNLNGQKEDGLQMVPISKWDLKSKSPTIWNTDK